MRKTREIIRLEHEASLTNRQIANSLSVSPTTVGKCLRRADEENISWPLPEDMDDEALEDLIYGERISKPAKSLPDMKYIHKELSKKGVTLKLLWEEYRIENPESHYTYAWFCSLYRAWAEKLQVTMRQVHKAGEKMFTDFAGQKMRIVDPQTSKITWAPVFVATMGFSNYTYVEACPTEKLPCWIRAHVNTFAFLGGVPHILIPDNLKQGVTHPCRYEPDLNPTYSDMAEHYGCGVLPARVRRPRDKAKVEVGVLQAERWVMAPLRNRVFHSTCEANVAIGEQLDFLNNRQMKVVGASRAELFNEIDRPALLPLPERPYELATWKGARANIDYHVEVEGHYYSVPYRLVGEKLDVRMTQSTIEIFRKGKRAASHARSFKKGAATTIDAHRPASHRAYLEWTPSRIISWAQKTGEATARLVEEIMRRKPHPEMGYRSCLGIIRLSKKYSPERVEAAARRALSVGAVSYNSVKSILETGLDHLEVGKKTLPPLPEHENVRGPDYYN